MKQVWEELSSPRSLARLIAIGIIIIFYALMRDLTVVAGAFSWFYSLVQPVLYGAAASYILYHVSEYLERTAFGKLKNRKAAHSVSVTVSILVTVIIIGLLVYAVMPQLISSVSTIIANSETYLSALDRWLIRLDKSLPFVDIDTDVLADIGKNLFKTVTSWIQANTETIISTTFSVGSSVMNVVLIFFMVIYMLLDAESLKKGVGNLFRALLPKERFEKLSAFSAKADKVFMLFLSQNSLDALIVGVLNFIFLSILGRHDYSFLMSVIAGITNFIPTFGPIIGGVINGLILLVLDPMDALWFILWSFALQTVDAYIIKPVMFGKGVKVKALWVLISILVGGKIAGVTGMILGIPVFSLISDGYNEWIKRRQALRTKSSENLDCPKES